MDSKSDILDHLAYLIQRGAYEPLESHALELKPVPSTSGSWDQIRISANAFLNTRGGTILLGVKEDSQGSRYELSGYDSNNEPKLKEIAQSFEDELGNKLDLSSCFRWTLEKVLDKVVALVDILELSADKKYAYYKGKAYKRHLTGDEKLTPAEIAAQQEYKEEASKAKELHPVPGTTINNIDLDEVNKFIQMFNGPYKIEVLKADLNAAKPFLERQRFFSHEECTFLGMLVCGVRPWETMGFRCSVHGYIRGSNSIAEDKIQIHDNVLPLLQRAFDYVWRNIRVGVSVSGGGKELPQYPEAVVRETINNALAHRDYSIDRQVVIELVPGRELKISNPGRFEDNYLVRLAIGKRKIRRVLPNSKPRNPKLANVLSMFRKWEGRGIGMSTLVNMALAGEIDIPSYTLTGQEVRLTIRSGSLLDEGMTTHLSSIDGYIADKLNGRVMSESDRSVLAYLIKSEWHNRHDEYTISLSPENNHATSLARLTELALVFEHTVPHDPRPFYVVDPVVSQRDFHDDLMNFYGESFAGLDAESQRILSSVYRSFRYSKKHVGTVRSTALETWIEDHRAMPTDVLAFDKHRQRVRYVFKKLVTAELLIKVSGNRGFTPNPNFKSLF